MECIILVYKKVAWVAHGSCPFLSQLGTTLQSLSLWFRNLGFASVFKSMKILMLGFQLIHRETILESRCRINRGQIFRELTIA